MESSILGVVQNCKFFYLFIETANFQKNPSCFD